MMHDRTWMVHHVNNDILDCMWTADTKNWTSTLAYETAADGTPTQTPVYLTKTDDSPFAMSANGGNPIYSKVHGQTRGTPSTKELPDICHCSINVEEEKEEGEAEEGELE